ncbi:hypothetical protein PWT90_06106 [Aphanocladium album]|nr:hypothetical protein PWT90_06106 [Aphanocladium album]
MSWSNDTVILTGDPSVPLPEYLRALIYSYGWGKVEFLAFDIVPLLSNVIFFFWAPLYCFLASPPKEKAPVDKIKLSLAAWLIVFEVIILVVDSYFGNTSRREFTMNDAMAFCSAFMTYTMLTVEDDGGHPPSKFIFFYTLVWSVVDFVKTWSSIFQGNAVMANTAYLTFNVRLLIATAQAIPPFVPSKELEAFLTMVEALVAEELRKAKAAARATARARAEAAQHDAAQPAAAAQPETQRKRKTSKNSRRKA